MGILAWVRSLWERFRVRRVACGLNRRMGCLEPEQYRALARMFQELHEDLEKGLPDAEATKRLKAIELRFRQFETGRIDPPRT